MMHGRWTMGSVAWGTRPKLSTDSVCVCVCVWPTGFHRHKRVLDVWTQSLQAEQVARWVGRSVFTQSNLGRLCGWSVSVCPGDPPAKYMSFYVNTGFVHMHTLLCTQLHFLPSCRLLIPPAYRKLWSLFPDSVMAERAKETNSEGVKLVLIFTRYKTAKSLIHSLSGGHFVGITNSEEGLRVKIWFQAWG